MSVDLRPGESQEALLKRFRKEVVKDRILSTYYFSREDEEVRIGSSPANDIVVPLVGFSKSSFASIIAKRTFVPPISPARIIVQFPFS